MSIYTDFILKNAPRVISQVDRDPHSPTYGDCDRNHWHLKIRDFTSVVLQQTGLTMALLYDTDFAGNPYYQNENLKAWAVAAARYWGKVQLRDGSQNEYYPHEHGFPPTAFALFSVCETYKLLKLDDAALREKIAKSARYLARTVEPNAYNQEMASITALYSAYTVLEDDGIRAACRAKLKRFLSRQTEDGWFPEYGGADMGYMSVTLDMLGEYYHLSRDASVLPALHAMAGFLQYFVHPDGTVGGEYGSRNTTYFQPNGLEVAAQAGSPAAAAMKQALYADTAHYNFFMDSVDDRYLSHYVLHSFLRALKKEQAAQTQTAPAPLPCRTEHRKYFSHSGLLTRSNGHYYAVAGLQKGGVLKVYAGETELLVDCGYRVNYGGGTAAATNWQDPSYSVRVDGGTATVSGRMNKIKIQVSKPVLLAGLRVVSFLVGRRVINFLKKKIILVDKHVDITFERRITFGETEIRIHDALAGKQPVVFERAGNMSLRHVASGKFFMTSDLLSRPEALGGPTRKIEIDKVLDVTTGELKEQIQRA